VAEESQAKAVDSKGSYQLYYLALYVSTEELRANDHILNLFRYILDGMDHHRFYNDIP
jgi:hypothetical protein